MIEELKKKLKEIEGLSSMLEGIQSDALNLVKKVNKEGGDIDMSKVSKLFQVAKEGNLEKLEKEINGFRG